MNSYNWADPTPYREDDYFYAMTDGQLGFYEDFKGDADDIENWSRG